MKLNRRGFFKLVGKLGALAAAPVVALQAARAAPPLVEQLGWQGESYPVRPVPVRTYERGAMEVMRVEYRRVYDGLMEQTVHAVEVCEEPTRYTCRFTHLGEPLDLQPGSRFHLELVWSEPRADVYGSGNLELRCSDARRAQLPLRLESWELTVVQPRAMTIWGHG